VSQDIQELLSAVGLDSTTFAPTSRYYGKPLTVTETLNGETIVHITRRFVPAPENFALLQFHFVEQGDRLDNIAHKYLADPEQFWKLCDANGVDRPDELTEKVGSTIRITLPEGVPGGSDA
jgi:nucleoid-associated protein YgaU